MFPLSCFLRNFSKRRGESEAVVASPLTVVGRMAQFAVRPSARASRAVVAGVAAAFTGLLIIAVALQGSRSSATRAALVAIDSSSGMRGPVCACARGVCLPLSVRNPTWVYAQACLWMCRRVSGCVGPRRTKLLTLPRMQVYMPETNGGFPRPWDEILTRGHPSLSSVQYMPSNSTVSMQRPW